MIDSKTNHVFHVWINSEDDRLREMNNDGIKPDKYTIDPHKDGLYGFKSAMQLLSSKGQTWLGKTIGDNRLKSLPLVHQQCSHSEPDPLEENYHVCYRGEKLAECPILKRLRDTFAKEMERSAYYREITDEQIDEVAAQVCVWHLLMGSGNMYVDWNEGAFQSVSDRMFWSRVYDNLSQANDFPDDDETANQPPITPAGEGAK